MKPTHDRDCSEGCDDQCRHKWQIYPHPSNSGDFDYLVCDEDQEARAAFLEAAEQAWDSCEIGKEKTISIMRTE